MDMNYDEKSRCERAEHSLHDELTDIALSCASLPVVSELTEDEILGYDEFGIPTRY